MCVAGLRRDGAVDALHGTDISDPFRWLEDRSLADTDAWIRRHQRKCSIYFESMPDYPKIREQLHRRLNFAVIDQPARVGHNYIFRRREAQQDRAAIVLRNVDSGVERELVVPDQATRYVSIGIYRISPDGVSLAFTKQIGGSDKRSVHFADTGTGVLHPLEFPSGYTRGLVFTSDGKALFYCQEKDGEDHAVWFNSFADAGEPTQVFTQSRRGASSKLTLKGDGKTLGATFVYEQDDIRVLDFWIAHVDEPTKWKKVFSGQRRSFVPLLHGDRLFVLDSSSASGFSLTEHDFNGEPLRQRIPTQSGWVTQMFFAGVHAYATIQSGTVAEVYRCHLDKQEWSKVCAFENGVLTISSVLQNSASLFLLHEDYCQPPTIYEYTFHDQSLHLWHQSAAHQMQVEISHLSAAASDGVQIPVTIVRDKQFKPKAPALVVPYGTFGTASTPHYSVFMSFLIESGVVLVIPHVRGGGEGGHAWHEAGRRRNKLRSVLDVENVLESLSGLCRVDSARVALYGVSSGGLLAAAVAVRVPQSIACVVCVGPLLDMIRYDRFGRARRWIDEFGSSELSDDFSVLYSYSPYHNIPSENTLPSFMFVTGDGDDRCDPAHVRKMAARLEDNTFLQQRVVVDYSEHRGHSSGLPLADRVDGLARRCAFLFNELGLSLATERPL